MGLSVRDSAENLGDINNITGLRTALLYQHTA